MYDQKKESRRDIQNKSQKKGLTDHNVESREEERDKFVVKILPTHKNSTMLGYNCQAHLEFQRKDHKNNKENKDTNEFN